MMSWLGLGAGTGQLIVTLEGGFGMVGEIF